MRDTFLPFCKPAITEDDAQAVHDVLLSSWITTGPWCAEFEDNFCKYTGAKYAVGLTSATAGMHLLMKALEIGPGDEIITPSLTWVSTINMITLAGATPVFADIDRDTLMITADTVRKCITPKTKLIIPVHYAGSSADLDSINELADKHNITVVEDAAHALGTFYKGRHIGGGQNTAIYSLHPIKNITTGEGGMFTSNDPELIEKIKRLKFHGLGVDAFDRKTQGRAPQAQVVEPGFKYNMTDISAVLGVKQLAKINELNAERTRIAMMYRAKLKNIDGISLLKDPDYDFVHAWNLFIIRVVSDKISRNKFMEELKKLNIGTGLHFLAAHVQKYYLETIRVEPGSLVNTEWNSDRMCSIPLFPGMTEADVDDVVEAIKNVLSKA
ncbi:MAG TPA: aminotransferase class I/II-fold pyridoxal phosphate-dependent enzyme [Victivallales bacterium]|nr:aminotransferase class I/II-fold pyridoxal phosphate-dependent enzyme [Victivallales bacterium]